MCKGTNSTFKMLNGPTQIRTFSPLLYYGIGAYEAVSLDECYSRPGLDDTYALKPIKSQELGRAGHCAE